MKEEIKKKLERLELGWMYRHLDELETAAIYQDVAEQISNEYNLYLNISGSACMWDAHSELKKQIKAKENELKELHQRLTEEEE